MKRLWVLIVLLVGAGSSGHAGSYDYYIQLLNTDIQARKMNIVADVMDLSDAQGERFWPGEPATAIQ